MQCHEGLNNLLFKEVIVTFKNDSSGIKVLLGLLITIGEDYIMVAQDNGVVQIGYDPILFVTKNSPMSPTTFEEWLNKQKIQITYEKEIGGDSNE